MLCAAKNLDLASDLLSNFELFFRTFFKIRTNSDLIMPDPDLGRKSHYDLIFDALQDVASGKCNRLLINVPPGYSKTEIMVNFIAWTLALYPDSKYLYVSYSKTLAAEQTSTVRSIVSDPFYQSAFGLMLSRDTNAKDHFKTASGGYVYAAGAEGTITGFRAGLKISSRFGGAAIIDDIISPEEVLSTVRRKKRNAWYKGTLLSRLNNPKTTPIICIMQRLHEDDLAAHLKKGFDGEDWRVIECPALDEQGRALWRFMHTKEQLLSMRQFMKYDFSSQYQQNPTSAADSLFRRSDFKVFREIPRCFSAFVTVDAAETDNPKNDATVFTFLGVYEIENYAGQDISERYGIHVIDCHETRVMPRDLEKEFLSKFRDWQSFDVSVTDIHIETKSAGTWLESILDGRQGLRTIPIKRKPGIPKAKRFADAQPYIAKGLVSVTENADYLESFLEHMEKINVAMTHAHDDICDTVADACQIALKDKFYKPVRLQSASKDISWGNVL